MLKAASGAILIELELLLFLHNSVQQAFSVKVLLGSGLKALMAGILITVAN